MTLSIKERRVLLVLLVSAVFNLEITVVKVGQMSCMSFQIGSF